MPRVTAKLEGMWDLQAKLSKAGQTERWNRGFSWLVDWVYARARKRAPGSLGESLARQMDARPLVMWAKISTDKASESGYRYPFVLEAGRRAKPGMRTKPGKRKRVVQARGKLKAEAYIPLRYASGASKGKSTRKWLGGALWGARKQAQKMLNELSHEIETFWGTRY